MWPDKRLTRRCWLAHVGALGLLGASPAGHAQFLKGLFMRNTNPETASMNWDISFCRYGIDIAPRESGLVTTLTGDNWLKDAQGKTVAVFYTNFGAAWGLGSSGMSSVLPHARLPKTLRLTYYDYLDARFYRLDAELPLRRLHELFFEAPKVVSRDRAYGQVAPRYDELRIGVAPDGYVMLWVVGNANDTQMELAQYRAQVLTGITPQSYNAARPPGSFELDEERWLALDRMSPQTRDRVKAGWRPDPMWYMQRIRIKYPWRHALVGNVSRLTELTSHQGDAQSESLGQWEMVTYAQVNRMRAIPNSAFFWFHDLQGKRHYLWLTFSLRERAVSEDDLSEVRAAFEQMFPGRDLQGNDYLPGDEDMARVEVQVPQEMQQRFTAFLVKGEVRLPLPVGRVQRFTARGLCAAWRGHGWKTNQRQRGEMKHA